MGTFGAKKVKIAKKFMALKKTRPLGRVPGTCVKCDCLFGGLALFYVSALFVWCVGVPYLLAGHTLLPGTWSTLIGSVKGRGTPPPVPETMNPAFCSPREGWWLGGKSRWLAGQPPGGVSRSDSSLHSCFMNHFSDKLLRFHSA